MGSVDSFQCFLCPEKVKWGLLIPTIKGLYDETLMASIRTFPDIVNLCYTHLLISSLALSFSTCFSIRSANNTFSTSVAYSILPCNTTMMRDATLLMSFREKPFCSSRVWMKHRRKVLLSMRWPKARRPFSMWARLAVGIWWGNRNGVY